MHGNFTKFKVFGKFADVSCMILWIENVSIPQIIYYLVKLSLKDKIFCRPLLRQKALIYFGLLANYIYVTHSQTKLNDKNTLKEQKIAHEFTEDFE